jgi:hypothetical protein
MHCVKITDSLEVVIEQTKILSGFLLIKDGTFNLLTCNLQPKLGG